MSMGEAPSLQITASKLAPAAKFFNKRFQKTCLKLTWRQIVTNTGFPRKLYTHLK